MFQIQYNLFYDYQAIILNSNFYQKYHLLFNSLDLSTIQDRNYSVGCTGFSKHAFIRAFIVKHLEEIKSTPQLLRFLDAHPLLTEMCGFEIGNLPDETQFYRFLKTFKHSLLENIFYSINKKLIDNNIVSMSHFLIDSKPIMAATRENNFKNPNRNTRNKNKIPKRNPQATLSYYSYQNISGQKDNFIFFWGHRTHVICSAEGIPLVEITLPNNNTDAKVARKLIKKLKRVYGLKKGSIFIADSAYDERAFYNFIVEQLKCLAFIPINPRNTKEPKTLGPHGSPICDAGLEMRSAGSWTENNRDRLKFRCPITASKKFAQKYTDACPCNHPLFWEGSKYGCTKYLDITNDARALIPRDSAFFKETYSLRTEIERYFSRLGDREAEQTTHYNLRTIKNQMTIAHLSLSLVAYAAAILLKQPDKIRCFKTFAEQFQEPPPLAA